MRRKRAQTQVATAANQDVPTLKEYMWRELGKLLREATPYSTSDMSALSKKKLR